MCKVGNDGCCSLSIHFRDTIFNMDDIQNMDNVLWRSYRSTSKTNAELSEVAIPEREKKRSKRDENPFVVFTALFFSA
jgi:hypothetical protein